MQFGCGLDHWSLSKSVSDHFRMVLNTQSYKWTDGRLSRLLRLLRAPNGANNKFRIEKFNERPNLEFRNSMKYQIKNSKILYA